MLVTVFVMGILALLWVYWQRETCLNDNMMSKSR